MARLTVTRDKPAMSAAAAERMTSLVEAAIAARGDAAISLTGGDTPDLLYQLLADPGRPWRARIDWAHVHLYWGDEREVPPDHPRSNFGLANRTLIQQVPIPATHIHRMRGELPATDAGRLYDAILHARRAQTTGALFDVVLLGIGTNAHIASIFPDSPLLPVGRGVTPRPPHDELATGVHVPELSQWRITLTPPALLDSAAIITIATGRAKAEAIAAAINGERDLARYPAQLLREAGDRIEWILDEAAAYRL